MRTRKTVDYLDAAKLKLGVSSDRALAPHLGLTQQAVSWYRAKGGTFDAMTATKIAEILEINPMRVIADSELERARSPAARQFWGDVLGKVAAVVAAVALAAIATYPANGVAAVLAASVSLCKIAGIAGRWLARWVHSRPAAALFCPAHAGLR